MGEVRVRASVVGLGYVGLVSAACLAEWGHEVVGIDADEGRLAALDEGQLPFFEPGLAELVAGVRSARRLRFAGPSPAAIGSAQVVFVAVGTHDGNGGWQTGSIRRSLAEIVPHMADDSTLVIRSTLPPDFIQSLPWLVSALRRKAGRREIPVLTNPEFTREGSAIRDYMEPDRIVMGIGFDPHGRGESMLRKIYRRASAPILVMHAADAALTKIGANLFLATKISFANELAQLCETYGADVDRVVAGMAYDPRIGPSFLRAGVGFGGSCLPHQVSMTVREASAVGLSVPLLAAVEEVNTRQRETFVERLWRASGARSGARIALLGLTFKPDTDDLREAPSLDIARALIERDAVVVAYDPMPRARVTAAATVAGLAVVDSATMALVDADAAGLVTEWREFALLDWEALGRLMRRRVVVDGRNALSPEAMRAAGFAYSAFGREGTLIAVDVGQPAGPAPLAELAEDGPVLRPALAFDAEAADTLRDVSVAASMFDREASSA